MQCFNIYFSYTVYVLSVCACSNIAAVLAWYRTIYGNKEAVYIHFIRILDYLVMLITF